MFPNSRLEREFSLLAEKLLEKIDNQRMLLLAVIPFQNTRDNKPGQLGLFCADKLTMAIFGRKNIQMVERSQIEKISEELALMYSGRFDEESIKNVGHFLGVDGIVIGTYTVPEKSGADINARILDVETGKILGVGSMNIPRFWIEGLGI